MCRGVGKRGKRQVSQLKELTADERRRSKRPAAFIWANDARRCLVDATAAGLSRIVDLHRLFNVGRVSGKALLFRQLHLALLFAGILWRFAAQLVWLQA